MIIDVALLPNQARTWRDKICVIVDVLRASSTIVVAFERGASLVIPVSSISSGRRLARQNGYLFCGENGTSGMNLFDIGNSPSEISKRDLQGKTLVLYTVNGSRVIRQNDSASHLLIGSLLNAEACCARVWELHQASGADVGIVCAGNRGQFALDDFVAAGYLVGELHRMAPADRRRPTATESATAASKIANRGADIGVLLSESWSGRWLAQHGPQEDVTFCAQRSISQIVPVARSGDGAAIVPLRI